MSKKESPKTVLFFVMNSKGGIGKSYLTYCIAQMLKISGVNNLEIIEADPETLTITRALGKENVSDIQLAHFDEQTKITRLKEDSFDEVLDLVGQANESGQGGVVLVDIGSNLYTQAVEYMRQINIEETIQLDGGEFWISSVAYMTSMEAESTMSSIEDLCSTFHNIMVLDNRYNGEARTTFEITDEADPIEVLTYPRINNNMIEAAKLAMSTAGISSIQQASLSTDIKFAKRAWLKQLYELLFNQKTGIYMNSAVLDRIASIGKGEEVIPIVEFHKKMRASQSEVETEIVEDADEG